MVLWTFLCIFQPWPKTGPPSRPRPFIALAFVVGCPNMVGVDEVVEVAAAEVYEVIF